MTQPNQSRSFHSRREFLGLVAAGMVGAALPGFAAQPGPGKAGWTIRLGICGSWSKWDMIEKAGCSYVEEGVSGLLSPKKPDAEFAKSLEEFRARKVPVLACNGFLPGDLKLVGPEARHDAVVEYASKVFERAPAFGVKYIVLGSGAARKVPEGFDHARAEAQFVEVLKRLGPAAGKHGVIVAMESLNKSETNFGNTLAQCLGYIDAAGDPNVRLVADLYHMLREEESPDILLKAGGKVVHCHIAEKAQRTPPGTAGDDFKPYLRALRKSGYAGAMSLECRWKNQAEELAPAVAALKGQIDAVAAEPA